MESLIKFAKEAGLTDQQIEDLNNPETDVEIIIAEWHNQNKELVKAKNNFIEQQDVRNKMITHNKTMIKKFGRMLGMEMTDAEANKIALEEKVTDWLTTAEQFHQGKISEIQSGTDEKLRTQLNELLTQKTALANQIDEIKGTYESKIQEVEQTWQSKYVQKEIDAALEKAFAKVPWADPERSDVDMDYIRRRMFDDLVINPDGTVLTKEGTKATNISGKGLYTSIFDSDPAKNPILDIARTKNLIKRSNGGAPTPQGSPTPIATDKTPKAAALEARLKEKGLL
jgi:hypothetical protein